MPAAQVEHSHNYTWSERYKRSFGDRSALAVIAKERPARTMLSGVLKPFIRRCAGDIFGFYVADHLLLRAQVPVCTADPTNARCLGRSTRWLATFS